MSKLDQKSQKLISPAQKSILTYMNSRPNQETSLQDLANTFGSPHIIVLIRKLIEKKYILRTDFRTYKIRSECDVSLLYYNNKLSQIQLRVYNIIKNRSKITGSNLSKLIHSDFDSLYSKRQIFLNSIRSICLNLISRGLIESQYYSDLGYVYSVSKTNSIRDFHINHQKNDSKRKKIEII